MKAIIDKDLCIGCGVYEGICPDVFAMDDDIAVVTVETVPEDLKEDGSGESMSNRCYISRIKREHYKSREVFNA